MEPEKFKWREVLLYLAGLVLACVILPGFTIVRVSLDECGEYLCTHGTHAEKK